MNAPLRRNAGLAFVALVASTGTLVCCVLPALMVALGAGAVLAGLVSAVPQLVWLSEHKAAVFGIAAVMLALAGLAIWRARSMPCPAEPVLARAWTRLRSAGAVLYSLALSAFLVGAAFAFVLPRIA